MGGGADEQGRTGDEAGHLEDPILGWLKSALALHECTDARVLASRITGLAAAAVYLKLELPDAWTPREPYEVTFSNPNNRLLDLRAYIEVNGEVFGPRARIAQKVALDLPLTALELIQREFFAESMRSDRDRASAIGRLANVAESTARSTLLKRGPTSFDRLLSMAQVMGYEFVLKKRDQDAPQA